MAGTSEPKKFSDDEISEIKETFALFDRDADGKLEAKDVGTAMRAFGYNPTEKQVEALIDGRLQVDFHEFLAILSTSNLTRITGSDKIQMDALEAAFKVFDREGNGQIKTAELKRAMTTLGEKLTEEEVDEMIKIADIDRDGLINYEEFVKLLFSK